MILYFSGTGNSLYVAKKLAELTGDTAVPISAIHERCQRIQDRIIGFVFPAVSYTHLTLPTNREV